MIFYFMILFFLVFFISWTLTIIIKTNINSELQKLYLIMYVIKKDHEHEMECHPRRSESAQERPDDSPKKPERRMKIRKLFNDNSK